MPKSKPCTVEASNRQIIEGKLLAALDDKAKVAIVCDEDDLSALIDSLYRVKFHTSKGATARQAVMLEDLRQLRDAAFPAAEQPTRQPDTH